MEYRSNKTHSSLLWSDIVFGLVFCGYFVCFYFSLSGRWFDNDWTTDDALQQSFMFNEVFSPVLYSGDLITEVMKGYLAPLHYWLSYLLTYLTGSPIQAGHLVMAIQLGLSMFFLFMAVKAATGAYAPAFFAITWFLHTRTVVQRMTGGLSRGWAAVVFAAFLYCVLSARHRLLLVVIFLGCLLHPPATFLICIAYSFWLFYGLISKSSRSLFFKHLKFFVLACPFYLLITLYVIHRPAEVGSMVDFATASKMPAFENPGGRFPFVPQPTIYQHFKMFVFDAFVNRLYDPRLWVKLVMPWIIIASFLVLALAGVFSSIWLLPASMLSYLLAVIIVYLVSRQVLFKLYVPDRHLLIPLSYFWISAFPIMLWKSGGLNSFLKRNRIIGLVLLVGLVGLGSGSGLKGDCNLNYHRFRKGHAFEWIEKNTDLKSVIAGHPVHVDPVLLFAKRRVYVSSEVAHPFYPKFYQEMERRLKISLRAHYAKTFNEFLDIINLENIDYFIFSRQRFYGHALKKATFYKPLDQLVAELTSRNYTDYAYKRLPKKVDVEHYPFLVFRDDQSAVVDLKVLRKYVKDHPEFGEGTA